MEGNLKDILSHLNPDIDQETLLLYLQDKLPDDKKHQVERTLVENEFASDAVDGLQKLKDKKQIAYMVEILNRDLKKKISKNKRLREKMKIRDQPWLYLALFIFIMLIILCYLVIQRMMQS
jgi:hypothetical protein